MSVQSKQAVAIILARGGSKGVPGKNLKSIGGLSLVARSILAAKASKRVAEVFVSTDYAGIASEAQKFGASIIKRPADISSDTATSESGWRHALDHIRDLGFDPEILVFLQCTSPFTTSADIDGCISAMEDNQAKCALSVLDSHPFLWTVDNDGRAIGINHDEKTQRARRQDLRPTYSESGAIYVVTTAAFEKVGRRFCGPVALYPVDHPHVEIDTHADLALCEAASQLRNPVSPDLTRVKALVMDFDGVHTDDLVHVDQNGIEQVTVSRRDGLGIERLRKEGRWQLLILSKERNPVVSRRAEKLQVQCLQARDDKVAALKGWLDEINLQWDDVLFVGNDINDLPALQHAGISACPRDAAPSVLASADWIIPVDGGKGVLRAIADALLPISSD